MDLEAVINDVWRYTMRRYCSALRDVLHDHDRATMEIHLEAMIKRVGDGF
jgi:hypothetical protein